jgi:hypothetical protein
MKKLLAAIILVLSISACNPNPSQAQHRTVVVHHYYQPTHVVHIYHAPTVIHVYHQPTVVHVYHAAPRTVVVHHYAPTRVVHVYHK